MEGRERLYRKYLTEHLGKPSDEAYTRWASATTHRFRNWFPRRKDARCLDLGCGSGNMLRLLQGAGSRGIDS